MTTKEIVGKNIKKYRKASGHTQQELGEKIGYSDSGVSAFEKGINDVGMETLKKIADIYAITIEDLLCDTSTPDFTISNICITEDGVNNIIDILFPVICTDNALQNGNFKVAYNRHKALYDKIKKGTCTVAVEDLLECYNFYVDVWNESELIESVVNMLGILFVACSSITDYDVANLQQKLNVFHSLEACQTKKIFDRTKEGVESLTKEKALFAENFNKAKMECLRELKKSYEWSQLADYYIAYSYIVNFTQNSNTIAQNCKTGRQLMEDYAELGNPYCINFFRCACSMYR